MTGQKSQRRLLHAIGITARRVVVYQDRRGTKGEKRIVVQWREWEQGARRYKVFPVSPAGRTEAVAYADGVHETLGRAAEPPEYTPEEFRQIVASFEHPPTARTWRPCALIVIAGTQGPRIRALMHLTWDDVDLEGQRVRWASAFDKTNRDRWQPLVPDAVRALAMAKTWREIDEYEGPNVFYSEHAGQQERPGYEYAMGVYRYQAAVRQLHLAEIRAGITPIAGRGFHGLRKCAAGNALELFGNPKDALDWIGDTDPRRLKEYAKKRDVQQQRVADGLAGSSGMRENAPEKLPKSDRAPNAEEAPEPSEVQGVVSTELRHHGRRATGQI